MSVQLIKTNQRKKQKIYTPEEAARAINVIYNDIEKWWNDPYRQKTVREFCKKYIKVSPNAVEDWIKEFQRIKREAKSVKTG